MNLRYNWLVMLGYKPIAVIKYLDEGASFTEYRTTVHLRKGRRVKLATLCGWWELDGLRDS